LVSDFTVVCYTPTWYAYAKFGYAMIVVYPFGIPAVFLLMLLRYRKRLNDVGVRAELGFLYDAYTRDMWWFEMADLMHKLAVTSLIAFLPPEMQMPFGMGIVAVYSMGVLLAKPYVRKSDDRLHLFAQTELILLLLAGNVFNSDSTFDPYWDSIMGPILIFITAAFFAFFLLQAAQALYKISKTRPKAADKAAEANPFDGTEMDGDAPKHRKLSKGGKGGGKGGDETELMSVDRRQFRSSSRVTLPRSEDGDNTAVDMKRNPMWDAEKGRATSQYVEKPRAEGEPAPQGQGAEVEMSAMPPTAQPMPAHSAQPLQFAAAPAAVMVAAPTPAAAPQPTPAADAAVSAAPIFTPQPAPAAPPIAPFVPSEQSPTPTPAPTLQVFAPVAVPAIDFAPPPIPVMPAPVAAAAPEIPHFTFDGQQPQAS